MRLAVATITSAVGLKGHVRLKLSTDDPAGRFVVGQEFFTHDGALTVAHVRSDGKTFQPSFVGHEDRNAAEALRDTVLSIETDDDELYEDEFFYHELIGLPVRTPDGVELGKVRRIQAMPAQDLIVVQTANGDVLVPFVEQIVRQVGADALVVDPPGGLFDDATEEVRP